MDLLTSVWSTLNLSWWYQSTPDSHPDSNANPTVVAIEGQDFVVIDIDHGEAAQYLAQTAIAKAAVQSREMGNIGLSWRLSSLLSK